MIAFDEPYHSETESNAVCLSKIKQNGWESEDGDLDQEDHTNKICSEAMANR